MKCPICKTDLEFSAQNLEEVYYDCSNCGSSLFFKDGECEVLSEGQIKAEAPLEEAEEPEEARAAENPPQTPQDSEQEAPGNPPQTPQDSEQEAPPASLPPEESATREESAPSAESENLPEGELEDFVPEESTGVPELNQPEEDFAETPKDSPDFAESSPSEREAEKPEDFQFEEEAESLPEEPAKEPAEKLPEEPAEGALSQTRAGASKKEDFSEVAEFGMAQGQNKQGPFIYDLALSQINSQDLREKVLELAENEALGLHFEEGEQPIKEGQITFSKISPVQAHIILLSLMGLPLRIDWKQRHIADSPDSSGKPDSSNNSDSSDNLDSSDSLDNSDSSDEPEGHNSSAGD